MGVSSLNFQCILQTASNEIQCERTALENILGLPKIKLTESFHLNNLNMGQHINNYNKQSQNG